MSRSSDRLDSSAYSITPRILRSEQNNLVSVLAKDVNETFEIGRQYEVTTWPIEGSVGQTRRVHAQPFTAQAEDGRLRFGLVCETEQEYGVLVELVEDTVRKPLAEFRLYALDDDLFALRPWKGDTHMHTHHSDGKESPAYVAARCREIGMDFAAITDHHRYFPSLEAIRAFEGLPVDLRLYPGEEVHPPNNPVHMVNFGGSFSVNDLFESEAYQQGVKAIEDTISDVPPGLDAYTLASCIWVFNQIRAGGGLGIFCHPYWIYNKKFDVPAFLTELILERQPFAAMELLGGYYPFEAESNLLQVARYHDARANGKRLPIVGASDAHGCDTGELFGWYYSVVFAPSPELPELIRAVSELHSVAVEAHPGEMPRAHGPYRLVKFSQYLLREVFPGHDALCQEEGRLMLRYIAGDEAACPALAKLQGQVKRYYDALYTSTP